MATIEKQEIISVLCEISERVDHLRRLIDSDSPPVAVRLSSQVLTLEEQIEEALRGPDAPLSAADLSRILGVTEAKVSAALQTLREVGKLYNLGTETDPMWWWIIGEEATATEVNDTVVRLISRMPMTFKQLMSATGCRRTRVSAGLIEMQKHRKDWKNLGTDKQYVWFLPPTDNGPRYHKAGKPRTRAKTKP